MKIGRKIDKSINRNTNGRCFVRFMVLLKKKGEFLIGKNCLLERMVKNK
jgi:hypothetical protein